MMYICPLCNDKIIDHPHQNCGKAEEFCDKKYSWFIQLKGRGIWRIRYLNKYEYQFFTEEDFLIFQANGFIILDEAVFWEDFDPVSYTGLNSVGIRTSIFS